MSAQLQIIALAVIMAALLLRQSHEVGRVHGLLLFKCRWLEERIGVLAGLRSIEVGLLKKRLDMLEVFLHLGDMGKFYEALDLAIRATFEKNGGCLPLRLAPENVISDGLLLDWARRIAEQVKTAEFSDRHVSDVTESVLTHLQSARDWATNQHQLVDERHAETEKWLTRAWAYDPLMKEKVRERQEEEARLATIRAR